MTILGFLALMLIFYLGFDLYTFYGLSSLTASQSIFCSVYWFISLIVLIGFIKVYRDLRTHRGKVRPLSTNLLLGFGFAVFVGKILFSLMMLAQDGGRAILGIVNTLSGSESFANSIPSRNHLLTFIFAILAGIPFLSMIYGMIFGKYRFAVDQVKLKFKDLPESFIGFRIAQISDIHSGTFDSVSKVQRGVDLIIEQTPDLILFTGDLVNSHKNEIDPYISAFASMQAPYGKFSIMGNHDYYGLYSIPKGEVNKKLAYLKDFQNKHIQMGFNLLNNTSVELEENGESIRLLGVENWGAGPFPKKGNLDLALKDVKEDEFCILMSHDPTHWDHHVLKHRKKIHLTLSGHTHGMQFGINLLGIQWSPVKYRYQKWMGLYEELEQYLYVNRGFGFLAWPGRVGMRPEITILELDRQ